MLIRFQLENSRMASEEELVAEGDEMDLEDSIKDFNEFIRTIEKGIDILSTGPAQNYFERKNVKATLKVKLN